MASGNGTVQSRQGMNGNYQKNNVVEIDLSALAIYSFKHWRVLIVLMIAFALIFGGAKAVKSKSEIKALESEEKLSEKENEEKASDTAVSEDDTDSEMPQEYVQYENTKDSFDAQTATAVESLKNATVYMKESVLYSINPNEVHRASLSYMIKPSGDGADSSSATVSILSAYISHFGAGDFYSSVDSDIDEKYIRELVKVSSDADSRMLKISIVGPDDELVEKIASAAKDEISSDTEAVNAEVAEHEISLISEKEYVTSDNFDVTVISNTANDSAGSSSDINVAMAQYEVNQKVSNLQVMINNANTYSKALTAPEITTSSNVKSGFKSGVIKYAVIGLFVGLIIFLCIYAFFYAVSQKLLDTTKFTSAFRNVNLLGDYYKPLKKHALSFDKFLASHDGRRGGLDDFENVMKLSSANLSNVLLSDGESGNLLITGTASKEDIEKFESAFTSYIDTLDEKPCKSVSITNGIIADFEGSKALSKADSVVLIESKSSSKISDIREEISEIGKIGKNLAGIILVD
jgi:cell division protein FtsL